MEISEFKGFVKLVNCRDDVKSILSRMNEKDFINISSGNIDIKMGIDYRNPLYPRLKKLLDDFVAETEEEIERIEIKPKEEK